MHKFLSILLCFFILLQLVQKTCVYVRFSMQRTVIANEKCVKRAAADNNCNGLCQLKTELEEQTAETPFSSDREFQKESSIDFFTESIETLSFNTQASAITFPCIDKNIAKGYLLERDNPPRV